MTNQEARDFVRVTLHSLLLVCTVFTVVFLIWQYNENLETNTKVEEEVLANPSKYTIFLNGKEVENIKAINPDNYIFKKSKDDDYIIYLEKSTSGFFNGAE
ncbi:MAG: hypothetical protein E7222_13140 [Clostridiales bacterium]|nr:hypothetical protein [Clostridiales bacterium]